MPREIVDKMVAKLRKVKITMPSGWKMTMPSKVMPLTSLFNCLSLHKDKTPEMIADRLKIHDAIVKICKKNDIDLPSDFSKLRDNPDQAIGKIEFCLKVGLAGKLSKNEFAKKMKAINRALGNDASGRKIFPE